MNQKTFSIVAGVVFAVVAICHLLRIFLDLPLLIGSWAIPIWMSWIGFIAASALSYFGLSLGLRSVKN